MLLILLLFLINKETGELYAQPCHISFYVEDGSTLILQSGTYEFISGAGNVYIDEDVVIENVLENDLRYDGDGNLYVPEIDSSLIPIITVLPVTTAIPETVAVPETTVLPETETASITDTVVESEELFKETNQTTACDITFDDNDSPEKEENEDNNGEKKRVVNITPIIIAAIVAASVVTIVAIVAILVCVVTSKKRK